MLSLRLSAVALAAALLTLPTRADDKAAPAIPEVDRALQGMIEKQEIAGAVTVVAGPDSFLHLSALGQADREAGKPMTKDALFWIASMTKPVTGAAIMMLQDEGKLSVDDPVAKYIPELAALKTPDGQPAQVTLKHLLTHTSGLAEASPARSEAAHALADLIPDYVQPLKFVPGTKWQYCQSGINTLGRIVEVVSGKPLPEFFQERLFAPLGMTDTTFYPNAEQQARLAKSYKLEGDKLTLAPLRTMFDPTRPNRMPAANGGLFSTAHDYARFGQMLLGKGSYGGKRYLSEAAVAQMTSVQSGEVVTGFTPGNGWGLGCCVIVIPQGVSAALSPGSFGHGGAFGTQAWVDPVKKRVYVLLVQRANFSNSDASNVRAAFQNAAAAALH